ncbi:glycosyltransferase family 4 protein [Sphingorhabdus soli]|uniref:Glycosyltransferase family 4 protein n=1 Tax=Flavisphingopyxis soli TaxID=2601267 RepID=A0A5C6ULY0_9SPHN|nr:glycosyltransferase family 4 protein [Sphingorhabdus soli]TXC73997.1 glycosyltransferase family 4 protein [Sphingorhabdus soli]
MRTPVRILHAHSTFSLGGKEARAVRLMNAFGATAQHTILSAMPGELGARDAIDPAIAVDFPTDAPSLQGKPGLRRYRALADYMRGFDLVLTYNWGAMDVVMAHRLFRSARGLPPLVHHEDGFNEDESVRRNWKRNAFRRLALKTASALVVPSRTLERIAAREWGAASRTRMIRNGIAVAAYTGAPTEAIPGLATTEGDVVIGTVAGLRKVKNLPSLVAAAAALRAQARLVIVGEGPERSAIAAQAAACGWGDRFVLPGFMEKPHRWIGHFDILGLSSLSEQAPIAVIEAMAAGLPVASLDVGDVAAMIAPENLPFIARDEAALRDALTRLCSDAALRRSVGEANRRRAHELFEERDMIAAYVTLYGRLLGDEARLDATGSGLRA